MICTFVLLLVVLITLIFYFSERNRFLSKVEDLTANLQKEMEDRLNLESRYNKVLNDFKKEEEFNKSKKIDETQLMFTKVNMLDDKLTYFNTTFKSKLDNIVELLRAYSTNAKSDDKLKEIEKIALSDVPENVETTENSEEKPQVDSAINQDVGINEDKNIENLKEEVFADIVKNGEEQPEKSVDNQELVDTANEIHEEDNSATEDDAKKEVAEENNSADDDSMLEEDEDDDGEEGDDEDSGGSIVSSEDKADDTKTAESKKDEEEYVNLEESFGEKSDYQNNNEEDNTKEQKDYNEVANRKTLDAAEEEINGSTTDKEIERALFEDANHDDIDFVDTAKADEGSISSDNSNNYDTSDRHTLELQETINDNNEETKLEEDLKANTDTVEGFDIKDSIEKLRAQLGGDDK